MSDTVRDDQNCCLKKFTLFDQLQRLKRLLLDYRLCIMKESYPPILHCAHLLLLLSGLSLQSIPYLGMNIHRGRDRKILSSIMEVMEVRDSEEDFHISDGNLSEEVQVEVNASPVAAQDIARGGEVLVATDQNVVRVV